MMKKIRLFSLLLLMFSLTACETTNNKINSSIQEIRGQPPIEFSPSIDFAPGTLVGAATTLIMGMPTSMFGLPGDIFTNTNAALLYLIYDPFAPNWSIKEKQLSEDTFYVSMRAKSFRTGGDGESLQILKRRAKQLQIEKSYASFQILEYSEGIESSTPFTHRVSEGMFQLVKGTPHNASAKK